jgi:hypothetical protein
LNGFGHTAGDGLTPHCGLRFLLLPCSNSYAMPLQDDECHVVIILRMLKELIEIVQERSVQFGRVFVPVLSKSTQETLITVLLSLVRPAFHNTVGIQYEYVTGLKANCLLYKGLFE